MKKLALLTIVAGFAFLIACEKDEFNFQEPSDQTVLPAATLLEDEHCATADYLTRAGVKVGTVTIDEVDDFLKFTFSTSEGWVFRRIHLYAGLYENIPMSNDGVPKVGQFEFSQTYFPYPSNEIFYIAMERIQAYEGCFVVTSQAEVYFIVDGEVQDAQYVWTDGIPFPGGTGAFFEYCLGCEIPPEIPPDDSTNTNLAPIPLESLQKMTPTKKPGYYPVIEDQETENPRN